MSHTTSGIETIAQARTIAANWQSPGTIGRTLAAFASGRSVEWDELRADAEATMRTEEPYGDARDELQALIEWSTTQGEPSQDSEATTHDLARVRIVVEDLAATAHRIGGTEAVVRYASETLDKRSTEGRMDRSYSAETIRQLVRDVVESRPELMTEPGLAAATRKTARALAVQEYVTRAGEWQRSGGHTEALRILRHAAAIDPDAAAGRRTVAELIALLEANPTARHDKPDSPRHSRKAPRCSPHFSHQKPRTTR